MDPKQRQHWLFQQLQLLQGASGPAAEQFYQFKAAYCAEYADPYCGGPTVGSIVELGIWFFPWTRVLKGLGALVGTVGRGPAIGFAPGLGASALTANRLQHGTRHLTDAGILPKWSGTTSPKIIRDTLIPILERPAATIDDVLGGTAVKGFVGDVNGQRIVVFVFKEGPYQGQLATSYVPSASQLAKWGL